jgi:hypothetical protein
MGYINAALCVFDLDFTSLLQDTILPFAPMLVSDKLLNRSIMVRTVWRSGYCLFVWLARFLLDTEHLGCGRNVLCHFCRVVVSN